MTPARTGSRREVAENQRARIFGAMVASVAGVGYQATGVDEVAEISGVSSRTIYNLFPGGKEECFGVVLKEILDATLTALSAAGENEQDWERRLAAIYTRFARMVAAQPAAASLVLTEAHAAGPAAAKQLERATRAFERLSRSRLEESPERAGLPAGMVEAQVGALQELARSRIRRGEADTLPALVPELVSLVASYRPPPERLRLGNRRPSVEADGISSSEEAERVMRGFTLAVAEHGFAATTIHHIVAAASMSPNTFYANFPDKRAVLLAAVDSATAQMQANATAAYRRTPGWAVGVRAAIGSALGFLAARPATANLLLAEIYAGGPEAPAVRASGLRELIGVLEEGGDSHPEVPPIAPEAIFGGILALARRRFLREGADGLPSLAPVATYLALGPYLGAEEACRIANGDGRARPSPVHKTFLPEMSAREKKWSLLSSLGSRWASEEELADQLGRPTEEIASDLRALEKAGAVERIVPLEEGRPAEWSNVEANRLIDGVEWAALTPQERRELTDQVMRLIFSHLSAAFRRGSLGSRLDEHQTNVVLEVDQDGWTEIAEIHRSAFNAIQAVRVKSMERVRRSEGATIFGHSMQLLFESPEDE